LFEGTPGNATLPGNKTFLREYLLLMVLREWEFSQRTWISIEFLGTFKKKNGCPVYLQVVKYPKNFGVR